MGIAYSASLMVRALKGLGHKIYHPAIKSQSKQKVGDVFRRSKKGIEWRRTPMGNFSKATGPVTVGPPKFYPHTSPRWNFKEHLERTKGIPYITGRRLSGNKKSLTQQVINTRYKAPTADWAQARTFKRHCICRHSLSRMDGFKSQF
jgi:hypothetical protein